jgi:predicted phosphohydrolase
MNLRKSLINLQRAVVTTTREISNRMTRIKGSRAWKRSTEIRNKKLKDSSKILKRCAGNLRRSPKETKIH